MMTGFKTLRFSTSKIVKSLITEKYKNKQSLMMDQLSHLSKIGIQNKIVVI